MTDTTQDMEIKDIVGQTFQEERVCFDRFGLPYTSMETVGEYVWITTVDGTLFVDEPRKGETLDERIAYYQQRGTTDDRCYPA